MDRVKLWHVSLIENGIEEYAIYNGNADIISGTKGLNVFSLVDIISSHNNCFLEDRDSKNKINRVSNDSLQNDSYIEELGYEDMFDGQ